MSKPLTRLPELGKRFQPRVLAAMRASVLSSCVRLWSSCTLVLCSAFSEVMRIINEPTAAALAFGMEKQAASSAGTCCGESWEG